MLFYRRKCRPFHRLDCSVADPGCLSRILIFTHPGSRIPDPKTATKERGEKNLLSYIFLYPQISQNVKLFYFWTAEKKILGKFQRIIELFTQKVVTKLSKTWVWDPGSRGQKGTGSRIRIRNTARLIMRRFLSALCSVTSAHDGGLRTADDRVARLAFNFDFQLCFILLSNQ